MKLFKLAVHQKTLNEDDVLLSRRDFPCVSVGDVVEIYPPEDESSRLLVQIKSFADDREVGQKDKPTVSVEQSIANTFQFRPYGDVIVNKVNTKDIVLDSVEIIFKDQYLARSDMWRTRCSLVEKVVQINKKFDYPSLRFQVFEMWAQGDQVACGYIDKNTKVVFRSASSMVYLFVQMSSEMWDFDIHGDLYFEKAINGFICELFDKWRRFNCNHDVTIVLFSRTYYDAKSIEEFPEEMRDCLQQDYRQRFYEDFYRIAVQNERYEDWNSTVILLKKLFNTYQNEVLCYHEKWEKPIPRAYNSTASQGNILEVLNMSLNVFEKHYMDRSFDRTGQLSVIISPGVGVFEVDYDLTSITKQRIIDNGIGSDLVCLGEQPLHAVPIFKYNQRKEQSPSRQNHTYSMPHWINLSFYSSRKQSRFSSFIPRIKMPEIVCNDNSESNESRIEDIEQCASNHSLTNTPVQSHSEPFSDYLDNIDQTNESLIVESLSSSTQGTSRRPICSREDIVNSSLSNKFNRSKKPINPFEPTQVNIKLTSNRRRWTHTFPLGPDGIYVQQHHFQALPQNTACTLIPINYSNLSFKKTSFSNNNNDLDAITSGDLIRTPEHMSFSYKDSEDRRSVSDKNTRTKLSISSTNGLFNDQNWTPTVTTGVDWKSLIIPACLPLTTDFLPDQRSLEKDFLDSEYTLIPEDQGADLADRRCYRDEDYHNHLPLSTLQVFQEFICQRLQQGFQIISIPEQNTSESNLPTGMCGSSADGKGMKLNMSSSSLSSLSKPSSLSRLNSNRDASNANANKIPSCLEKMYILSIGHMFHKVEMDNFAIKVKISRPRVPRQIFKIHYCYQFRAPDNYNYGVSWVDFSNERVENYNWNYLDNYICLRGDEEEYELRENLKFWRLRLLLLPSMHPQTRQILENIDANVQNIKCDIYHRITYNDKLKLQDGFLRFFGIINRIRRQPLISKKVTIPKDAAITNRPSDSIGRRYSSGISLGSSRAAGSIGGTSMLSNTPGEPHFRDRLSSSVLRDRPKNKGSLGCDRNRDEFEITSAMAGTSDIESARSSIDLSTPIVSETTIIRKKVSSTHLPTLMEAIKGPNGIYFLPHQNNWPPQTFLSVDAVAWALENVEGLTNETQATALFQRLMDACLINHGSGNFAYPFKYGIYFYFVVNKNIRLPDERVDLEIYKREWFEVEMRPCRLESSMACKPSPPPVEVTPIKHPLLTLKNPLSSLRSASLSSNSNARLVEPNVNKQMFRGTSYYKSLFDIDSGVKSGRIEWVHIRYQQLYDTTQAFEIVLEWMVATCNQISDIVQNWARKAGLTGLHLVPIPSDPFALPFSSKSDPLRSPIYISLNFDALPSEATEQLLSSENQLLEFRLEILIRFGFVPFLGGLKENQKQYVHASGAVFVLIPNPSGKSKLKKENSRNQTIEEEGTTMHEVYISRHFSGLKQNKKGIESIRTGFIWSWNYMISKRWKSPTTGDENFQRTILKDFRLFCSNDENRLFDCWKSFAAKSNLKAND